MKLLHSYLMSGHVFMLERKSIHICIFFIFIGEIFINIYLLHIKHSYLCVCYNIIYFILKKVLLFNDQIYHLVLVLILFYLFVTTYIPFYMNCMYKQSINKFLDKFILFLFYLKNTYIKIYY